MECYGEGAIELYGSPEECMELETGDDPSDYFTMVFMAYSCRKKTWTPVEFLSQPAKWVEAYMYVSPYISKEMNRKKPKNASSSE